MRQIVKETPAMSWKKAARRNVNATWEALTPGERRAAAETLAREQHSWDGYTERLLRLDDKNTHIDHFRKRTLFPQLTFDWENLILAEHSTEYGADAKDNYSELKVRNKEDYQNLIDPVHEDPHQYFSYLMDGEMVPRAGLTEEERWKALFTIDCFCLNNMVLKQGRCDVIEAIRNLKNGSCDRDDIIDCLKDYNYPSVLEYFCSTEIFCML